MLIRLTLLLCAAVVLLTVLHLVRPTVSRRWPGLLVVVALAFVVSQVAFGQLAGWVGLYRESQIDRAMRGLPTRPALLIVGSSFSARGIVGDDLERTVQQPVAQLTYPGVFAFEQDIFLMRYVETHQPAAVLIELGTEIYAVLTKEGDELRSGYIAQADPPRTLWALRILLQRSDMPVMERIDAAVLRLRSFAANVANVGFVRHMAHQSFVVPEEGYAPLRGRAPAITDDMIRDGISRDDSPEIDTVPAADFRRWQREQLLARGVRDVRFFVTPKADPVRRAETKRLCRALSELCIDTHTDVLQSLAPDMWFDMGHLNETGARVYTQWLANQLNAVQ